MPLTGRAATVPGLLRPLGWVPGVGFTEPLDREALRRLGTRLRRTPGRRLLISNEDLAEAGAEHVDAVRDVADSAGVELRIIVTARDLAKQLPSEYQQLLKHRLTVTYDEFLEQVRRRKGVGEQFWRRQDLYLSAIRGPNDSSRATSMSSPSRRFTPIPAPSTDFSATSSVSTTTCSTARTWTSTLRSESSRQSWCVGST